MAATKESCSVSEAESAIDLRRRERAIALKERRRRRWMNVGIILAPVLLAAAYSTFIAVPRYQAESRFFVQAPAGQQPSAPGNPTSLLTTGASSGMPGGFVDGWAVKDFLNSRDCMRQLDKKIGLRHYLTYDGLDLANRLPTGAGEDELFKAYNSLVSVSFNMMEQIDVLRVNAFSPAASAVISQALIDLAQQFVNRMNDKGVADSLKVSKKFVEQAELQAVGARAALANWRISHGNIDPTADAAMLQNLVGQLEVEQSTAQINLDKIRALNNPDHPMLRPAQLRLEATQTRLDAIRRRLSGAGNTAANQLKSYEMLKNAQTVADSNLANAHQTYQQALIDTLRLQRYLTVIARPVPANKPSSPNKPILLLEALALGFVLAFAVRVASALCREFRHG